MSDKQTSTILKGIKIKGEVRGEGNIRIEGELEGEIAIAGDCFIEGQGTIQGNITSNNLHVAGTVLGNLTASDRVEIHATGKITGDIRVPRISIADGASVNGNVSVGEHKHK